MGAMQQALLVAAAGAAAFTPAALFGVGDTGGFWDFTDASTLFSDSARTTPATVGNQIQGVTDKSGTGRHLQTGSTTISMQAGYADFPGGVNGFTVSTAQVGSATQGYFCIVAIRPVVGVEMAPIEADFGTPDRIAQALIIRATGDLSTLYFNSSGTSPVAFTATGAISSGIDYIVANQHDTAGGSLRVNRSVVASDTASATPSVSVVGQIAIGSAWEGAGSSPGLRRYHGRMYAAFWINRQPTGPELTALENWFGALIGI